MIDALRIAARLAACFVATLMLAPGLARAADPAAGERAAAIWCASCHAITRAQPNVRTEAPTFAEIARIPQFSERVLAFYLLDPHPKMPDMNLTRAEAANLAAYISSLRD